MNEIVFSYNWNYKLNCNAFTTIRLMSMKYKIGEDVKVVGKGIEPFIATVVSIKTFKLAKLNEFMSYIDTGYSVEECKKLIRIMYKNMQNVNVDTADWAFILLVKKKS